MLRKVIWLIYRVINRYIHGPSGDPRDETQQDGEHGKVGRRSFRRGFAQTYVFGRRTPLGALHGFMSQPIPFFFG